jgi:hypothetical protein
VRPTRPSTAHYSCLLGSRSPQLRLVGKWPGIYPSLYFHQQASHSLHMEGKACKPQWPSDKASKDLLFFLACGAVCRPPPHSHHPHCVAPNSSSLSLSLSALGFWTLLPISCTIMILRSFGSVLRSLPWCFWESVPSSFVSPGLSYW